MLVLKIIAILLVLIGACADDIECGEELCEDDSVGGYGTTEGGISSSSILSINGTYGAGCVLHPNASWSMAMLQGAPLDYPILEVAKKNSACALTLVSLRTGSGASELYTTTSPILLRATYFSSALFTSALGSVSANARLSTLDFAATFAVTLLVSENVQTSGTGASTYYAYDSRVLADGPLSYWRLDDTVPATLASEDFAGTAGTALHSRVGGQLSWARSVGNGPSAILSNAGRLRVGTKQKAVYLASFTPSTADYAVSADVFVTSVMANDQAGVIGRASGETYYYAGLVESVVVFQFRRFELWKYVGGVGIMLASSDEVPVAGSTRRITLEMVGTTIRASLDGTQRIVVTDNGITAAGSPGVVVGANNLSDVQSDVAGLHLDNLSVRNSAQARDSKGVNHAIYLQGVTRGASGALAVPNAGASFDGVDDYIEVARQIGNDFSIELWFKSTQGLGAASVTQWHQTAGLIDAGVSLSNGDFGIGLRSDGKILAGTGKTTCMILVVCGDDDQTLISSGSTAYNDGAWHHVVFVRSKAAGAMVLYVDGLARGTLASGGSTHTLDAAANLNIGRLQTGLLYFAGSIDEVALYTNVLTAEVVASHYRAGRHQL